MYSKIQTGLLDTQVKFRNFSCFQKMQCGKLGYSIVVMNTIALGILLGNLAIQRTLQGTVSLSCSAIILPSMMLFGAANYFKYIIKPIEMGIGFAFAFFTVKIDPKTGVWLGKYADWAHFYDGRLSSALCEFFKNENAESIVDLGCGMGHYVQDMKKNKLNCIGFDGNPNTPTLSKNTCKVADLTTKNLNLNKGKKYDWVLSLEVGEHLPKEHESTFLDNITTHAKKGVVLSWAKKNQGGLGHVNEQDNTYIEAEMIKRGWIRDINAEKGLRIKTSPHCMWYSDTIMVYRR